MSRPILPVPPLGGNSSHSSDSPRPSNTPGSEQQKRQYTKRGAISKIACRSCRRRKTKCNSERPTCSNCAGRTEQCIYDYDESDRSLTFLRENVENLAEERTALESMLRILQTDSEEAATEIFRRLRSGIDLHTLAHQVHASRVLTEVGSVGSPNIPSSTLSRLDQYEQLTRALTNSNPTEVEEIVRRLRGNADPGPVLSAFRAKSLLSPLRSSESAPSLEGEYSDQAFQLVKGSGSQTQLPQSTEPVDLGTEEVEKPYPDQRWTNVTQDENFISHLFLIYFSWQHTFFQNFPEHLFRADYASGQTKYCSRLLVNSICAAGCLLSRRMGARNHPDDFSTAGEHFYNAALEALDETRQPSICTVAAMAVLAHYEGARGHLRPMWDYCGRSGRMALDLSFHLRGSRVEDVTSQEDRMSEEAQLHTFWGCFIADQVTSFTLGRLPQIPINSVRTRRPLVDPELDAKEWIAYYDGSEGVSPGARSTTFKEVVSLCAVVNSTLTMFFNPSQQISGTLLLHEYSKYLRWKHDIPPIMSPDGHPTPHVLCAHLLWHAAVLLLFRPFLKAKLTDSDVVPQDVCRQSANAISELFAKHRTHYDLTGIYAFHLQCLLTACTIHIIHMPAIASTEHFIDACNNLHDMVDRSKWAKSSLDEIKRLVKKWSRVIPRNAESALYRDDRKSSEPDALPAIIANLQGPSKAMASPRLLMDPPESSDKRGAPASLSREMSLAKRPRMSGSGSSQLFAPSESQPAPLPGPMMDGIDGANLDDELAFDFPGFDFSGDDLFDPFMGLEGNWRDSGPMGASPMGSLLPRNASQDSMTMIA